MTNHRVLNNTDHKDTKVMVNYSAELGHKKGVIEILPNEILRAQCEYPILFFKDEKAKTHQCVAVLGFDHEENLFLTESGSWQSSYVPNIVKKGPFSIGFQNQQDNTEGAPKPVILINMDDERVNEEKGQAIFAEFGGNTQYLEGVQQTLGLLDDGVKQKAIMFEAFEKFNLLEPMVLDIKIDDEKTVKFEGYHSVSFERLNQLNANELDSLNKLGLLSIAFAVAVSLNNFDKLVRLKRQS